MSGEVIFVETSVFLGLLFRESDYRDLENKIKNAERLLASRLLKIESERAIHRTVGLAKDESLGVRLSSEAAALWSRMDFVEMTQEICDQAGQVFPRSHVRSLDAIHIASYLWAKKKIPKLQLFTRDKRILEKFP